QCAPYLRYITAKGSQQRVNMGKLFFWREAGIAWHVFKDERVHLVLRDRVEADLHRPTKKHLRPINALRPISYDAPTPLPRELRAARIRKRTGADCGEYPVRRNYEIVSFAPPYWKARFNTRSILDEIGEFHAHRDLDTRVDHPLLHDPVQHTTHDPAAARNWR